MVHSFAAKIFDPLGLLAPVLVVPRLIAQDLWRQKDLVWDSSVPQDVVKKLAAWSKQFQNVHEIVIPRCVKARAGWDNVTLVVFCDSSKPCQATAGCMVTEMTDGHNDSRLWACKQKLSSINKEESIPRQELISAVLAVKLATKLCSNSGMDMQ